MTTKGQITCSEIASQQKHESNGHNAKSTYQNHGQASGCIFHNAIHPAKAQIVTRIYMKKHNDKQIGKIVGPTFKLKKYRKLNSLNFKRTAVATLEKTISQSCPSKNGTGKK